MAETPSSMQANISSAMRSRWASTRSGDRMDSSLVRTSAAMDSPLPAQRSRSSAEVAKGWGAATPSVDVASAVARDSTTGSSGSSLVCTMTNPPPTE